MKRNREKSASIRKVPLAILAISAALQMGATPLYAHEGHIHSTDYSGHWSEAIIVSSIENKLLSGYHDGSVRPDDSITRAELAVLLTKAYPAAAKGHSANLADVRSGAWYESAAAQAVTAGYLSVNDKGAFQPSRPVTRAEASAAFAAALHWEETAHTLNPYKDRAFLPAGDAGKWLLQAVDQGYIEPSADGYLLPQQPLTRAEAILFLSRAKGTAPRDLHPPAVVAEQKYIGSIEQTDKGFALKANGPAGGSTVYSLSGGGTSLAGTEAVKGTESGSVTLTAAAGVVPGKLLVLSAATGQEAQADQKELDGILLEGHHSNISDPAKHTRKCLLMPGCASSGFGISVLQEDGTYKFYKFDTRGHQLAAVLLDSIERDKNVTIHASGIIEGDILHVTSVSQNILADNSAGSSDKED